MTQFQRNIIEINNGQPVNPNIVLIASDVAVVAAMTEAAWKTYANFYHFKRGRIEYLSLVFVCHNGQ